MNKWSHSHSRIQEGKRKLFLRTNKQKTSGAEDKYEN